MFPSIPALPIVIFRVPMLWIRIQATSKIIIQYFFMCRMNLIAPWFYKDLRCFAALLTQLFVDFIATEMTTLLLENFLIGYTFLQCWNQESNLTVRNVY